MPIKIQSAINPIQESIATHTKGAVQVDYILAVSIFLIFFALSIQYTTDYFSTIRSTATISSVRSQVISLLAVADDEPEPATWPEFWNITNDLVLLLRFNNGTLDYSSYGNNGTAINGTNCAPSVDGRFYSACNFDGINDHADVNGSSPEFAIAGGTFAAWVKFKGGGGVATIASMSRDNVGADNRWQLHNDSGTIRLFWDILDAGIDLNSGVTVELDKWYHAAYTFGSGGVKLYVDGAERASNSNTDGWDDIPAADRNPLTFGRDFDGGVGGGRFFLNGTIDEIAVFNRTLSAAEISELYQQSLNRIGLKTEAFRFIVIVNNTKPYLVNTSVNATARTLADEIVRFNLSDFGFSGADYNSVVIYNATGDTMPFMITGSNVTFRANVTVNTSIEFTVYFDDDSLFGEKSQSITGVDNLTETFLPIERIPALQYEKLRQLNISNYTNVLAKTGTENDFRIKLADADTNETFMEFGGSVPRRGNVVALQRYAVFQNSTAGIRNGRITIQSW